LPTDCHGSTKILCTQGTTQNLDAVKVNLRRSARFTGACIPTAARRRHCSCL